jgi:hypothetical protein
MEKFKMRRNPICQKCQKELIDTHNSLRMPSAPGHHDWSHWVCDCEEMYIYPKEVEMCLMGCCKEKPKQ